MHLKAEKTISAVTRRSVIWALPVLMLSLAGCGYGEPMPDPSLSSKDRDWLALAPRAEVNPEFGRYLVEDPTGQPPGTIIVDTKTHFLYYVLPKKKAIRYGIATGAGAYGWTGVATVGRKEEWPHWMPPADMVERWPHLQPTADAGGLPGGPENPLGARALYLFQGNKDTLYRIHGTNEPDKIGQNVSSGCIRMRNIDAIDLYNRVKLGTRVVVE
ncbi:putative L,D-transpeptidase ErfK/SrfK [Methylovirgula sp. HY1]|nr:putative L,D-transpeptidase ErfK/SrfK [Methylovirgula sp. HY1]